MTMHNLQACRYDIAKKEFKEQMDPTDEARSFYVNNAGYVIGFSIRRDRGGILEYDATEHRYLTPGIDKSISENFGPEEGVMDLPPYVLLKAGDNSYLAEETHAFPDPYVNDIYASIRKIRDHDRPDTFSLALVMTELDCSLVGSDLVVMATKAIEMSRSGPHSFTLPEITSSINDLLANGFEKYDERTTENILMTANQQTFSNIVAKNAQDIREWLHDGADFAPGQDLTFEADIQELLSHLPEPTVHQEPRRIGSLIQSANQRAAGGTQEPSKAQNMSR